MLKSLSVRSPIVKVKTCVLLAGADFPTSILIFLYILFVFNEYVWV